ncbi:MAG TPA: NADH-quinone oxidoreductase subunit NuoN [Geminicoccaceae bacterium]|nr:NADH-quinone oxidoreductase subunit NuoN [Geminicoccaceae bacterium]
MPEAAALDLGPALPELFLLLASLALLLVGALREDAARLVTPLAALALVVTAVICLAIDQRPALAFLGHFRFDAFAAFLKVVILAGAALCLLLARGWLQDERLERYEYALLVLFSSLGMMMMVSANSFLALYMALELQSLPLYVLASFDRDDLRSTESGLKFFVLGALSSGILLYGCSLVYGFTGTLSFDVLAASYGTLEGGLVVGLPVGALVGLVFVIAGLAFKLAAVPFHMWTPDVYEGAPTPVASFIATAAKIAAIGLTLRVLMQPFGEWVAQWQQVVILVSVASMFLGSFAAIGQTNIKRLMAYSGIGHMGYALVGLAAGTTAGVYGVLIYMTIYLVMTLGTFGCIMMMRRQGRYVEQIDDLAGLSRRQPMMAAAIAIFMFSLAGIPPLAGFFAKLYVFMAAIDAGLTLLAVAGVVASVIGAYYYLRIVKLVYFDEPAEAFDGPPPRTLGAITMGTALVTALFIVIPGPLLRTAEIAAQALVR